MYTTTRNLFTIDFAEKKIYGTKASFAKAGKGSGDAYEQLTALMAAHPAFEVETRSPKTNASKETYRGLTIDLMRSYLTVMEMSETLTVFEQIKKNADAQNLRAYPYLKKWFLKNVSDATVVEITDTVLRAGKAEVDSAINENDSAIAALKAS